MRRERSRPDAGFLLAETLITFALSALVLVGLASSAAVLLRATDRSVAQIGSADDLGRTLDALTRDVSGLTRARWSGDEPQGFVFRGGPNSLFFAQEVPVADGGRERRVVSFREIASGSGTALVRAEAHLPATATGWASLAFGPARAVATGPARLRFRYVAETGPDGRAPRPVDSWPSGPTLPAAVVVEAVDAATTRLLVSDRVGVRADGDIGCADRTTIKQNAGGQAGAGQPAQAGTGQPTSADPATGLNLAAVGPQQQAAAAPLAQPDIMNVNDNSGTANVNEFCGRADKGTVSGAPGASPPTAAPR